MSKFIENLFCLILATLFYYTINYKFLSIILFDLGIRNILVYILLMIMGIILTFIFFRFILNSLRNKKLTISKFEFKTIFIIYILSIVFLLLARDRLDLAYSEIYNINPLDIFTHKINKYYILVFIFNVIVFAPASLIFNIDFNKFLIFIFSLELLQFIFKVGFFDIDDILLYIVGFAVGKVVKKLIEQNK